MQIIYASNTIQRLCEEDKHQRKQLGEKRAKRLKNRIERAAGRGQREPAPARPPPSSQR